MISQWIDLTELGSNPWVLPIYTAINQAVGRGATTPLSSKNNALGLHLTTRLNILPRVLTRLSQGLRSIEAQAHQTFQNANRSAPNAPGVALTVSHDTKYLVIADVQSLLTELNTAHELIRKFALALHAHAGHPLAPNARILPSLPAAQRRPEDGVWLRKLDRDRNFVAHEGTLYLAIDISNPASWDFFLRKSNTRQFRRPADYCHLADLRIIVSGFDRWKARLQTHLVDLFNAL
ncbi:hypothetical protein [Cupriavidus sp. IK-TO18]|uniref:hypothetical protein n=1 Tax=Cupriavidus sp. IK-TO18 TaxID=2782182 RepID=UPI001896C8E0|nr:hypothetical protein [Cupriavidus sp. IK-TO18]MBF6986744.1 hypothetical protein [Cupriavidus sp. IK-TO18]